MELLVDTVAVVAEAHSHFFVIQASDGLFATIIAKNLAAQSAMMSPVNYSE